MLQVPPGTHPPKTRTFAKDEVLGEIYEFLADQEECFGLRDPQLRRLLAELGGPHPADDWTDDEKRGIYLDMLRDFARNGPQLPTDILRGLSAKPHATNWRMIRPNQVKYAYFDIISAVAAIYCAEQYDPAGAECGLTYEASERALLVPAYKASCGAVRLTILRAVAANCQ